MVVGLALVRNLKSSAEELHFANFRLVKIGSSQKYYLEQAQQLFKGIYPAYEDWVYERCYDDGDAWNRMGFETEDTLLLLRLFKNGDLFFVHPRIKQKNGSIFSQFQYPAMVDVPSMNRYEIEPEECSDFDRFAAELLSQSNWSSTWFKIARRFFLYGGSKEFNPSHDEVDRIVDYMIALESTLVPEMDFVGSRVRERAVSLLRTVDGKLDDTKWLVREFYRVRSAVVHGSTIISFDENVLKRVLDFESIVRTVIVEALKRVPHDDAGRREFLAQLFEPNDEMRVQKVFGEFCAIKGERERRKCFDRISKRLS